MGRYQGSSEEYSKEELVAEITAAMLCHGCGVDSQSSIKNSAAYIQGWSRFIKEEAEALGKKQELVAYLSRFKIRPVLTAHPTQFYPGEVLGIINDLSQAIRADRLDEIRLLLAQLGKTPFFKKEKPKYVFLVRHNFVL